MSLKEIIENTDISVEGTPAGGVKNEVRTGKYNGKPVFMKYSGPENLEEVKRGFKASKILYSGPDIRVPEPIRIIEHRDEVLALFEDLDITYPEREKWEEEEFCRETLEKAIDILEEIQNSEELRKEAESSEILNKQPDIIKGMRDEIELIEPGIDDETVDLCRKVLDKLSETESRESFSHSDMGMHNFIFEGSELKGVFDWEYAGFFDSAKDRGKIESSVIDEFIGFFHPEKRAEYRELMYDRMDESIDVDRVKMYRFFQNAVSYSYIVQGECSESWKAIGTVEEIKEYRGELLEERKKEVKDILDSY